MNAATASLRMIRPDDWHLHLRDGETLRRVLPDTAARFARAIVMPNLNPPVTTVTTAEAYRARILAAVPVGMRFTPLMTLYLTESTLPDEIARASATGWIHGVKWYPVGATTHSAAGVRDIRKCDAALEMMAEKRMPLLVHGEVTDACVDVFDREKAFIDRELMPLLERHPALRVVFEHITTADAVQAVHSAGCRMAATITAHHLHLSRNALFAGGIRPHHYCLPLPKREMHRLVLIDAATSGSPQFFLGTDSAPHGRRDKESSCGCAGIYTAHAAIELYAEIFDQAGHLDRLEDFASRFGADFYHLPYNTDHMTLQRDGWVVPASIELGADALIPFRAGGQVDWRIVD